MPSGFGPAVVGDPAIATLRAHLHELAAEFHELVASVHDWRVEEHAEALRHSYGDANFHELWRELRRTAAAAERARAHKERHAAMYWRAHPQADGDPSD